MGFNSKLKIVIGVMMIGLIGGGIFASGGFMSCESMIVGSDKIPGLDLSSYKYNNIKTVKTLTEQFCTIISKAQCVNNDDLFDANQSVFVTLLCDNVGKNDLFTNVVRDGDTSILLKTGFTQFGIYDYGELTDINFCDYKMGGMNGCNYAEHLPKMFDEIMNDFFNIKQADLYGVDDISEEGTIEELINNFSNKHFVGLNICDSKSEYYGDTCKYLKNYMKNIKNLLNQTKVINIENLLKSKSNNICDTDKINNILYCGLLGDDITPEKSFLHAVYNEYLWYRLFISYYSYELSVDANFSELMINDPIKKMNLNRDKIYSFQEKMNRSRQAISIAFRSLSEISASFSLHIGFLMYQEDAKIFMKQLSKLYPPIMTLFDKLRNVQKVK